MRLSFPFLVFVTAMLVVIATPLAYGQTSPASDGNTTPVAGRPCPQWVHDQYVTTGPDGKMYATWHPPVDPQFGCVFGHGSQQTFDVIELWYQARMRSRVAVTATGAAYLLAAALRTALILARAPVVAFAWAHLAEFPSYWMDRVRESSP